MIFAALIKGMLLGLVIAITLGPAFFAVIQTSIDRGFRYAILIAIGVLLSDITLIYVSYIGLSNLLSNGIGKVYSGIAGGIILILFGIYTFYKKPDILKRRSPNYKTPTSPSPLVFIAKGFFLNAFNPTILIFWIALVSYVRNEAPYGRVDEYALFFFLGMVSSIFSIDLLKSFIGYRIKKYLRPRIQLRVNHIVGICMVSFGIVLLVRLFIL